MEKKSVKRNYIYNTLYQMIVIAMPIITMPHVSRVLGVKGIGIVSYTNSIATYFMILAILGTSTYAQREVAFENDDRKKISVIFYEVLGIRAITTTISLILYLWMVFQMAEANRSILLIQGIYIISVFFDISWFFQGLEEFKKIIIRNLFFKVATVLYIFTVVKKPESLLFYALGLAGFALLGNISIWIYLPKYICKVDRKEINVFRNIRTIIELFIPTVAIQIYTVLNKTMIGIFTESSSENGYYEQAEKMVKVCLTIITSLGTVMVPRIAYIFKNGSMEKVKESIYRSYRFTWFLGIPICLGLIAGSDKIVLWFLGSGFENCSTLVKIFSILVLVIGISNVTGVQYLVPVKKQNVFTITVTVGAAINLLLSLVLIPKFFSVGAAISSVIAETVITILQLVYVIKDKNGFSLKRIVLPSIGYWFWGGIMFGAVNIVSRYVGTTFFDILLLIGTGIIVYCVGMIIHKDEFLYKFIFMINKSSK